MKKYIALILFSFTSTLIMAQRNSSLKGNKIVTTVSDIIYQGFHSVEIDGDLEVSIIQGPTTQYRLTTDENLVAVFDISVRDSILRIKTTQQIKKSKEKKLHLTVHLIKSIIVKNRVELKGVGILSAEKFTLNAYGKSLVELTVNATQSQWIFADKSSGELVLTSDGTEIVLDDKADLEASIKGTTLLADLTASSNLTLEGNVEEMTLQQRERSDFDGKRLSLSTLDLRLSDKTSSTINVDNQLELFAEDKSSVYIYGKASMNVKALNDKAKIIKK